MIIQKSSKVKNCFAVKRNTYKIYMFLKEVIMENFYCAATKIRENANDI